MPPRASLDAFARSRGSIFFTIAALALTAWSRRFVQDDAFISFRYAEHLARGLGLVWNPGEPVEGYTNFLWTLLLAIPHRFGIDPVAFSQVTGILLFAGTLAVTASLARRALESSGWAWLAIVLLGTNASFNAYATGGLETQLQALLITASFALTPGIGREHADTRTMAALSLVAAGALMTRLDSALPVGIALVLALRHALQARSGRLRRVAALVVPCGILVGAWLAWKLDYYGDLLPNTFYVKAPAATVFRRGVRYLSEFLLRYGFFPAIVLALVRPSWVAQPPLPVLAIAVLSWGAYVLSVGGDFMEFRMLVPLMPLAAILVVAVIRSVRPRPVAAILYAALIAASCWHAATFRGSFGIESVRGLESHLYGGERWVEVGRQLGRLFPDRSVMIAVTPAGAIPYMSKLPSIDMLGLNDRWVARHGALIRSGRAGHRRIATYAYLRERQVHLVLGHPVVVPTGTPTPSRYTVQDLHELGILDVEPHRLTDDVRIVEIPIEGATLCVLALQPSRAVEHVIRERKLVTRPILRTGP